MNGSHGFRAVLMSPTGIMQSPLLLSSNEKETTLSITTWQHCHSHTMSWPGATRPSESLSTQVIFLF